MGSRSTIMGWYFSGVFLFTAAVASTYSVTTCACFLAAGLLMHPPLRQHTYNKTRIAIPALQRACIVFALVALATAFHFRATTAPDGTELSFPLDSGLSVSPNK